MKKLYRTLRDVDDKIAILFTLHGKRQRMKRFLCILLLQLLLVSCADAVTPTVEMTPQVASTSTSTPVPFVPILPSLIELRASGVADTPPEFTTGFGGEVKGISQAEIDYLVAWETYQKIYREEVGANEWPAEVFVAEMLKFIEGKSDTEVMVQQDQATGRVLVALVKTIGDQKGVYWDYKNGVLANTNPMSLDTDFSDDPGLVKLKPGLSPQFRFNPVDGHWYMFAVDKDGNAVEWFATDGASEDNQDKQWVEVPKEPELFTLGYSPAMNEAMAKLEIPENYTKLLYADGTEVPMGFLGKVGSEYVFSGVLTDVINLSDYDPAGFNDSARGVVLDMILPNGNEVRICLAVMPNPLTIMTEPVDLENWYDTGHKRISGKDLVVETLSNQGINKQVIFTINSIGANNDTDKGFDVLMNIINGEQPDLDVFDTITYVQLGVIWMSE